jgi:hypothetical protein
MVTDLMDLVVHPKVLLVCLTLMISSRNTSGKVRGPIPLMTFVSKFMSFRCCDFVCGRPAGCWTGMSLFSEGLPQTAHTFPQSSSIIATVAGQAVSEGFLNWRVSVGVEICFSASEN